jgi:DNA-binding NarL/FixJ family response regulator
MAAFRGDPHTFFMLNIRVLLRDTPKMLRDILEQAISNQPDMELMPEPDALRSSAAAEPSPDIVIVDVGDGDPFERARPLLLRWPDSQVLTIAVRGHRVLKYELLTRAVDLGELSPEQLAAVILSIVPPDRKRYLH